MSRHAAGVDCSPSAQKMVDLFTFADQGLMYGKYR